MKRFLREQNGSSLLWAVFIILALCVLSVVVYSGVTVYAKYQTAENELQRAATVTVDRAMENDNVRDMVLEVPAEPAEALFRDNMIASGWTQEDGDWVKRTGDKLIYRLENMQIEISDKTMHIDAVFVMPLPWAIGSIGVVRVPMQMCTSILYVN
ncbi:MAG: hypothetical protein ACOYU3_01105 [Bacillota bacterium]